MPKAKFPATIHVTRESDRDEEWLSAHERIDGSEFDQTTEVAVYQLVEVGQVTVARTFESKSKGARRSRTQ